jgi:hypothetical protein
MTVVIVVLAGNFVIPFVRPGTYNLFAFKLGVLGTFQAEKPVVVEEGTSTIRLGDLEFKVPRFGPKMWEIGVPDRRASKLSTNLDLERGIPMRQVGPIRQFDRSQGSMSRLRFLSRSFSPRTPHRALSWISRTLYVCSALKVNGYDRLRMRGWFSMGP